MSNDNDPIQSAIATTILCLGLALLIPALARVMPDVHLNINLEINNGIQHQQSIQSY